MVWVADLSQKRALRLLAASLFQLLAAVSVLYLYHRDALDGSLTVLGLLLIVWGPSAWRLARRTKPK